MPAGLTTIERFLEQGYYLTQNHSFSFIVKFVSFWFWSEPLYKVHERYTGPVGVCSVLKRSIQTENNDPN